MKLDGQVILPAISEYLSTSTFNPYQESFLTFVFDTQGMPEFQQAVLQFTGGEESKPFPTGAPPAVEQDACKDWETPSRFIAQFPVTVTPAADPALSGTHRQVKVDLGKTFDGIPNHTSQFMVVRVVPVIPLKGGGQLCLNGPSTNTVSLTAEMDDIGQDMAEAKKKHEADSANFAALQDAAAGADGRKGSPITVEPLAFLPEFLSTTYSYLDELVTIITFHADDFEADFPIGCAFNVQAYLSKGPPKHWYDPVVLVLDSYAQLYAAMEHAVANLVVTIITLDQCEPPNPIDGSGGTKTAFCDGARSVTYIAVQYAATLIGLPPSLPTVSGLTDDALTWAATQAADYGLSYVPGGDAIAGSAQSAGEAAVEAAAQVAFAAALEKGREALIQKIKEGLYEGLKLDGCYFKQPPNDGTAQAVDSNSPFAWEKDPASDCYTSLTEIYSFGKKNMAFYPRDAVIYLRVKKNPAGIGITRHVLLKLDLGEYFNAHPGSPFALDHVKTLGINVDELPDGGAIIPITLYRSYNKFIDAAKVGCINCLDDDQAQSAWWHGAYSPGATSRLKITSDYIWTNAIVQPNGAVGAGRATAQWLDQQAPINKEIPFDPGFSAKVRLKSPAPCPGFAATAQTTYVPN